MYTQASASGTVDTRTRTHSVTAATAPVALRAAALPTSPATTSATPLATPSASASASAAATLAPLVQTLRLGPTLQVNAIHCGCVVRRAALALTQRLKSCKPLAVLRVQICLAAAILQEGQIALCRRKAGCNGALWWCDVRHSAAWLLIISNDLQTNAYAFWKRMRGRKRQSR